MGANTKISSFTEIQTVEDSAYFNFVYNDVNYKMRVDSFLNSRNLLGKIEQDGAATGTPILDITGATYKIRNLESGKGILTSVSAENGATIEHNFTQDATGTAIVSDIADASPTFRSLVEGEGVSLTESGDSIEIEFTGIPTDVVIVNTQTDFPPAVSGVITLADDTAYQISGDVDIGTDRIAPGDDSVIYGTDSAVSSLTYTGSNTMFEGSTEAFKITKITLSCPSAQLFDIDSASGFGVFQLINSTVAECAIGGAFANLAAVQMTDVAFDSVTTEGFTFNGSFVVFVGTRNLFNIDTGTFFNLTGSTFTSGWSLETCFCTLAAGTTFLDGNASSGNIGADALGTLFNTRFSGAGAPLGSNITVDDARWQFFGNDAIQDSRADGLLSLNANATATTITISTTPVLIAGTWTVERAAQFTGTTAGRLTYKGVKNVVVPVTASLTAQPVSGTNKTLTYHLYKNGADIGNADQSNNIDAGDPKNTSLVWQLELEQDDYLELYVSNDTDTINVVVNKAIFRVN